MNPETRYSPIPQSISGRSGKREVRGSREALRDLLEAPNLLKHTGYRAVCGSAARGSASHEGAGDHTAAIAQEVFYRCQNMERESPSMSGRHERSAARRPKTFVSRGCLSPRTTGGTAQHSIFRSRSQDGAGQADEWDGMGWEGAMEVWILEGTKWCCCRRVRWDGDCSDPPVKSRFRSEVLGRGQRFADAKLALERFKAALHAKPHDEPA